MWSLCVSCGAWAALSLWEGWQFTRNATFLEQEAYPVLKGAAEFFLGHMVQARHSCGGWVGGWIGGRKSEGQDPRERSWREGRADGQIDG